MGLFFQNFLRSNKAVCKLIIYKVYLLITVGNMSYRSLRRTATVVIHYKLDFRYRKKMNYSTPI